jgi:hypothetical protein
MVAAPLTEMPLCASSRWRSVLLATRPSERVAAASGECRPQCDLQSKRWRLNVPEHSNCPQCELQSAPECALSVRRHNLCVSALNAQGEVCARAPTV